MQRTKYMLTIDGKPAYFIGGQICFARTSYRGAGIKESELVDTPREARRLIRETLDYRTQEGWDVKNERYGYIPIKLGE